MTAQQSTGQVTPKKNPSYKISYPFIEKQWMESKFCRKAHSFCQNNKLNAMDARQRYRSLRSKWITKCHSAFRTKTCIKVACTFWLGRVWSPGTTQFHFTRKKKSVLLRKQQKTICSEEEHILARAPVPSVPSENGITWQLAGFSETRVRAARTSVTERQIVWIERHRTSF